MFCTQEPPWDMEVPPWTVVCMALCQGPGVPTPGTTQDPVLLGKAQGLKSQDH